MPTKKVKFNSKTPLDHDAAHRYLWDHSNPNGHTITVNQSQFADQIGATRGTVTRMFAEFLKDGRMIVTQSNKTNIKTYKILDPDLWAPGQKPAPRRIMWG